MTSLELAAIRAEAQRLRQSGQERAADYLDDYAIVVQQLIAGPRAWMRINGASVRLADGWVVRRSADGGYNAVSPRGEALREDRIGDRQRARRWLSLEAAQRAVDHEHPAA